jgi:peptidoglycan/LPS O-acetylase OafA/YrhL
MARRRPGVSINRSRPSAGCASCIARGYRRCCCPFLPRYLICVSYRSAIFSRACAIFAPLWEKFPLRLTFHSKAHSDKYRPDIDGLRAVAVLPVLFFHAQFPGFAGGYVGVDIFYVISGYLITSLIAKDVLVGTFSFSSFYERRIRRIFPALFGVLFFCVLVAAILFAPNDFLGFAKSMIAMTFFASNIYFKRIARTDGYFDHTSESQTLLHTWSLSVEEQFYLLFPAALFLLARWAKGRLAGCLIFLASISFLINIWATHYRPVTAFYFLIPRAWELLLGAVLAMKVLPPINSRLWREVAALFGLALIGCAVSLFNKDTSFPGVNALFPCLGAALIIYAGENGDSYTKGALSFGPLVFIGVISYSLYLWHWPLIVFARYFSAGDLTSFQKTVALLLSAALAFISFEFIEGPFRGRESTFSGRQIFALGLAASMVSLAVGFTIYLHKGFPGRYNSATRQLVLENTERKEDFQEVCGSWRTEIRSMSDIHFCTLGPDTSRKVMFWGDSHVQQLYPLIKQLRDSGKFGDLGVLMAIANGCAPAEHLNTIEKGYHCDSFAHFAKIRAEEADVDTVFIGFNTWWAVNRFLCPSVDGQCVGTISVEEARRRVLQELAELFQRLTAEGKKVIISLPFPMYDKSIPDLEIRNAVFGRFGLAGVAKDITVPIMRDDLSAMAKSAGATIFDPRESLCDRQSCITELNGVSIYMDDNHIAASQIHLLEDNFKQALQSVLPQATHQVGDNSAPYRSQ